MTTKNAIVAAVPHSHQRAPARRITRYSNARATAMMTVCAPSIFSRSSSQGPNVCVAIPYWCSRTKPS